MLQNTRNRLVAPGFPSRTGFDALAFEPASNVAGEMNRLVSAVLRPDAAPSAVANAWVPAVDVEETEDAVRLAFEVPGVAPEAIEVTVHDRVLTVCGERSLGRGGDDHENARRAYRLERRFGRFARSLTLPDAVDADRIQARYEYGVLHLELPKRPEAQPRRIAVTAAPAQADATNGAER